jgi:hypothetical protein
MALLPVFSRQAIQAHVKINSIGPWIDRTETVSRNDLFHRISAQELEALAKTSALPERRETTVSAFE